MADIRASMSGTSMRTATWDGLSGFTKVLMFVTPRAPKTSARFGEESQWSLSFVMSWCPMIVGIAPPTLADEVFHGYPQPPRLAAPGFNRLGLRSDVGVHTLTPERTDS